MAHRTVARHATPGADIVTIGRSLGVRYIVRGSHADGGRPDPRIGPARRGGDGEDVWGRRYDLKGDVLKAEDAVTQDITTQLIVQMRYRDLQLAKRTPVNELDPYGFYLLGKEALYRDDFRGSRSPARCSIRRWPRTPIMRRPGAEGPRRATGIQAGPQRHAAQRGARKMFALAQSALKLAPNISDAQQVVADVYLYRGQYEQAIDLLTHTIIASADDVGLHQRWVMSRSTPAIRPRGSASSTILSLDPFVDQSIYAIYGRGYILANLGSKAIQNLELCMARAPEFRNCFLAATVAYAEAGELDQAKGGARPQQGPEPRADVGPDPRDPALQAAGGYAALREGLRGGRIELVADTVT